MNSIIVILSFLLTVIGSVNSSMSRQDISRESNTIKYNFQRKISSLNCTGHNLMKDTKAALNTHRNFMMNKTYQRHDRVIKKLQTIMDEYNNIEESKVYRKCFENAEEKLRRRFEEITKVDCTETDMAIVNYVIAHMRTTVQSGHNIIAGFDNAMFHCSVKDVGIYAQCAEKEFMQMEKEYEDFKREYENSMAMASEARKKMTFPCIGECVERFFQHAKIIETRGKKCMRKKDLSHLEYTDAELLLPY